MSGRFQPRPTRFVGTAEIAGWRLKRYEITLDGLPVGPEVNDAVDRVLGAALPRAGSGNDGLGFLIVHRGAEALWVLADLWFGDIIHQHTFSARLETPTALSPVAPGGPTACVWELLVHAHERDAYIAHILDPADGPDTEAYLVDTVQSTVLTLQ